eukprot:TRINITY_DN4522_c0_g1_i5.p2 TRINITY_DN4522_c0_g1~~TRINITY_DN4522_c0_g1_i5.p2  ORF type:complete len:185 (+),score=-18.63 TRINITY_DN4522_c0_g1_i5:522-1076(+)
MNFRGRQSLCAEKLGGQFINQVYHVAFFFNQILALINILMYSHVLYWNNIIFLLLFKGGGIKMVPFFIWYKQCNCLNNFMFQINALLVVVAILVLKSNVSQASANFYCFLKEIYFFCVIVFTHRFFTKLKHFAVCGFFCFCYIFSFKNRYILVIICQLLCCNIFLLNCAQFCRITQYHILRQQY